MNDHPGTDMERVRLVLARELETINQYERLAREADSPEVRAFFLHLAAEEKEHVTEATLVLRRLDPKQEEFFAAGIAPGHFEGPPPAAGLPSTTLTVGEPENSGPVPLDPRRVLYSVPAGPSAGARPFTVGPLRGRRD